MSNTTYTHTDWKAYKKKRGLTNAKIAEILGITADTVKDMTQPNKKLPRWAVAMLYENSNNESKKFACLDFLRGQSRCEIQCENCKP
jgi:hypothetical protein